MILMGVFRILIAVIIFFSGEMLHSYNVAFPCRMDAQEMSEVTIPSYHCENCNADILEEWDFADIMCPQKHSQPLPSYISTIKMSGRQEDPEKKRHNDRVPLLTQITTPLRIINCSWII